MENDNSKIEINIMGDFYVTHVDATNSSTYHNNQSSNYDKYELEDRKREEMHRKTRDRFYRANAL